MSLQPTPGFTLNVPMTPMELENGELIELGIPSFAKKVDALVNAKGTPLISSPRCMMDPPSPDRPSLTDVVKQHAQTHQKVKQSILHEWALLTKSKTRNPEVEQRLAQLHRLYELMRITSSILLDYLKHQHTAVSLKIIGWKKEKN